MIAPVNVLALDLGTATGWASMYEGALFSGIERFELRRGSSPGQRYQDLHIWLHQEVFGSRASRSGPAITRPAPRFDLIVYEQTISRGHLALAPQEIASGLVTHLQSFCSQYGIEHTAVYPSTLKKWTTGKGNAKKEAMLEAVARRWRRVDSHDEADAIALLYYALAEIVGPARIESPREGVIPMIEPTACAVCGKPIEPPFIHVEERWPLGEAPGYLENFLCCHAHLRQWVERAIAECNALPDELTDPDREGSR